MNPQGMTELWLTRHGESTANVAASTAERAGAEVIDVEARDVDVPLSLVGVEQATALGGWLAAVSPAPTAVWSSPYRRAIETATTAMSVAGREDVISVDERLRDRELGILDTLTPLGVQNRYPDEARRREWVGRYFYRPPGGESWADVSLRIRSVLRDLDAANESGRVLVVAHDAVVMLFLHVCLGWNEQQVLDFALRNTVLNASLTRLTRVDGLWTLTSFASAEHLVAQDAPVTVHSGDDNAADH